MSLERIEARIGKVQCLGATKLSGFAHSFSHCGDDGSGKGNIAREDTSVTWGVAYKLRDEQAEILHRYEVGYELLEVSVDVRGTETQVLAYAYMSEQKQNGLIPNSEYLGHYRQGMAENHFPESYMSTIEKQAGR